MDVKINMIIIGLLNWDASNDIKFVFVLDPSKFLPYFNNLLSASLDVNPFAWYF